jgi:hypothetical protein
MFAKLIKTSVSSNFLYLPIVIIAGWWSVFINIDKIEWLSEKSILLSLFPPELFSPPVGGIIAIVFTIASALIMIPLTAKYFHNSSSNLLPSVLYLILISQVQWVFKSGPSSISLFFCVLTLRYIFETYHQNRVFHFGFMAGFFTALATLVYLPSVLFLLVCWTGLILLRSFKLREFLIVIVGFIVPLIFTHAIFMLLGNEQKLYYITETVFAQSSFQYSEVNIIGSSLIGVLFLWGVLKAISSGSLKKIVIRRYFVMLTLAFIFYSMVFFFSIRDMGLFTLLTLFLSFILSIAITSVRKTIYATLFIVFLILLQIVIQIPNIFNI